VVYGRVQGVFFRGFVAGQAAELGLSGEVRNLADGTVEVRVEGERDRLEALVVRLKQGPPAARVTKVETKWTACTGAYDGFRVRY